MKKAIFLLILAYNFNAHSQDCPTGLSTPPPNDGTNEVRVEIISMKLNSDMEGDDDFVPYYDNKADVYGKITIAGEEFDLPKIVDNNYPHWSEDGVFTKTVSTTLVDIRIDLNESDGGITFDDDDVDLNPENGKSALDLEFDLCSLIIGGDIDKRPSRNKVEIFSGSGDSQGTISFRISTSSGRPSTTDDIALTDVRFVQVVYDAEALVTNKPTVVMAKMANNYSTSINTNFNFSLSGSGVNVQNSFPITLAPFEVRKEFFFIQNPILLPTNAVGSNNIAYMASIDDPGSANLPGDDCKSINDGSRNRYPLEVISTPLRYKILWTKTGTLLDGFNMVPDNHFDSIVELGSSYIDVTYPMNRIHHTKSDMSIIPPLSGGILAFVTTILSPFLPDFVDPRAAEPFAMVIELDAMAHILQYDRILAVLPSWDWFDRYPHFDDEITGLSLGEYAPGAVIFEPRDQLNGPAMTLPAHELGHTFGLSVDAELKDSWVCNVVWPVIGTAGCGIVGGYDEYESDTFPDGNIASGFWIEQGTNSDQLSSLINQEQCDSRCFMGPSIENAHLNWNQDGKWIDNPDYNQLLHKLSQIAELKNNSLFISGLIAHNDSVFISSVFKRAKPQKIMAADTTGVYQVAFRSKSNKILKRQNIKAQWKYINDSLVTPITPFSYVTEYSDEFDHFTITNRKTKKEIYRQSLSSYPPSFVDVRAIKAKNLDSIKLKWNCRDSDSNSLRYMVLARKDRDDWIPISSWLTEPSMDLKKSEAYTSYKVLAWDSINLVESKEF